MQKYGKMTIFGILIVLIVAAFATLSININAVPTLKKVWVDDDFDSSTTGWGVTHFDTVQDGVNAVNTGGAVYVYTGTYYENVVIGKSLIMEGENQDTTILQGTGSGYGIYSNGISGITIKNLQIKGFYHGIYLLSSGSSTIKGNTVTGNSYYGILLSYSGSSTVKGNIATDNFADGIQLAYSGSSTVKGNTVTGNHYSGIYLIYSGSSTVKGNTVQDNGAFGIYLLISGSSTVKGNTITGNSYYGIYMCSSGSSTVKGNTVTDNTYGIFLLSSGSCIVTDNAIKENTHGMHLYSSSSNSIYHNNFIDNTNQLSASGSGYTSSTWDDGSSVGNYWSDYEGDDTDYDGIGDTDLPHQGVDYYPLMDLYS